MLAGLAAPGPELLAVAEELLPGAALDTARLARGQFHDVVLLPEAAAVRVARTEAAAACLPRRTRLLSRLQEHDLPFLVPAPVTGVRRVAGRTAVAVSWVPGAAAPAGTGDPEALRGVLDALATVPVHDLEDVLDVPHAYAGRERWEELLRTEVLGLLPVDVHAEVLRRVDAAGGLPDVPHSLVHGDLAGHNMHWDRGRLVGVLDWDLASAFDPAVDAACLAWHGWEAVARAVDADTLGRARTWFDTFVVEQVASALAHDAGADELDACVRKATDSLRADAHRRGCR